MSESKEQANRSHVKESDWKRMKLVSIAFKEASLDTPSFRASVNYFHTRIEVFQEWIEKVVDYMDNKYASSVDDFQRAHNTFISLLLPSPLILRNGFVANQFNTPSLVETFNQTYHELSSKLFKIICEKDVASPGALLELMNTAIDPYKDKRGNFEYYQAKYDNTLGKYQAIKVSNTNLEPSTIREDAFQIFEIRKEYLKASLELTVAISRMKLGLDKFILDVMKLIQARTCFSIKGTGENIELAPSVTSEILDYSRWLKNALESSKNLTSDMEHAKQQVMDYSLSKVSPSRELSDYNLGGINLSSLLEKKIDPTSSPEKSGWLYMKTAVGSPSRVIWVRRWCFLKSCVFGLFLLSSSKTWVEETNKFGVMLTSVRYAPDEDRKFCFEVKIINGRSSDTKNGNKDIQLIFQAESLNQLKLWLNVFQNSKKYASKLEHNSIEYDMAFKRYSPQFLEFASSTTTSMDQLITTCDENTTSIMNNPESDLSNIYMESSTGHKFSQFQFAITPIATKLTQMAVMGNLYRRFNQFPDAVLANIWGSANWSDYAIYETTSTSVTQQTKIEKKQAQASDTINYPTFFSNSMRINDIQFKSLFFTINREFNKLPDEFLLFSFSAFWCPNKRQKFSATCYVTVDHMYSYMNSMGFICLTHRNLSDYVSVEVDSSIDNLLRIYDVNGTQIKMFVYFTDRHLLAAKLQFLLENKSLAHPKKEEEVLKRLNAIEVKFQEKQKKNTSNQSKFSEKNSASSSAFSKSIGCSFWSENKDTKSFWNRRRDIQREYTVMYRHAYEVSSKCLAHVLYGDYSTAFPRSLFLATKDNISNINGNWVQNKTESGEIELMRKLEFKLNLTDNFIGNLHRGKPRMLAVTQRMVGMVDNKYYEVKQDPITIKVPFCRLLKVETRHIISSGHEPETSLEQSSSCMVYIFFKLEFVDGHSRKAVDKYTAMEKLVLSWAKYFTSIEYVSIRQIIRYYLEKIGRHGRNIKAIKVCGMIGVMQEENKTEGKSTETDNLPTHIVSSTKPEKNMNVDVSYSLSIIFKVLLKLLGYRITNLVFLLVRFVFQWVLLVISSATHINKTLLIGLLLSTSLNMFLYARSSLSYWSVKRAETAFHEFTQEAKENSIKRAISITDLDLLSINLAYENDNMPYRKFNQSHSAELYQFKSTRGEIAGRRNELLIELKILQNMERELVQDKYQGFLERELKKCNTVQEEAIHLWNNDTTLQEYCDSCRTELYRISTLLL